MTAVVTEASTLLFTLQVLINENIITIFNQIIISIDFFFQAENAQNFANEIVMLY